MFEYGRKPEAIPVQIGYAVKQIVCICDSPVIILPVGRATWGEERDDRRGGTHPLLVAPTGERLMGVGGVVNFVVVELTIETRVPEALWRCEDVTDCIARVECGVVVVGNAPGGEFLDRALGAYHRVEVNRADDGFGTEELHHDQDGVQALGGVPALALKALARDIAVVPVAERVGAPSNQARSEESIVIVFGRVGGGHADAFDDDFVVGGVGVAKGRRERWQEQRHQKADDGHDDHQFDNREASAGLGSCLHDLESPEWDIERDKE